jgi:hypothetical protein
MLLLSFRRLIPVTFSTPTGDYTQNPGPATFTRPKSAWRRLPIDFREARFWITSGLPTVREVGWTFQVVARALVIWLNCVRPIRRPTVRVKG